MHTARPDGKANDIIASVFLPLRSGKRSTTVLEFSRLFLGGRTAEAAYRLRFSSQSTRKAVRLAKVVYEPPALVGVGFVTAAWPDGELCQMKRLLRWQVHAASTLFFFLLLENHTHEIEDTSECPSSARSGLLLFKGHP